MIGHWNGILTALLIILLLSVLSSSGFAQEDLPTWIKSIRFMGGLGYANITYPGEFQEDVLDLSETHIGGIAFDLGVYVPLSGMDSTAIGINGNGALDNYTYTGMFGESISMTINHALFSLSSMHFFGRGFGSGPFIRADAGLSWLQMNASGLFTDVEERSDFGLGFLLGGGIAFPVSGKGKVLLNVNYSLRRVEGDSYRILGLSIGYLY